jgi:ribonuclease E
MRQFMANKMLIDATHPEETRVVVLRGNRVEEFDFETAHRKQLRGNIYLAKVTRVEPSLQAAFVDYGGNRHGFLAFSEIHPDYYQIPIADRQALLEADARAARDSEDEDDDHRRGRRHGRRGRREAHHARRDEAVQGDAFATEEQPIDAADMPASDGVAGDPLQGEAPGEPVAEPALSAPASHEAAPFAESTNPPVPGEIAAEPTPVAQPDNAGEPGYPFEAAPVQADTEPAAEAAGDESAAGHQEAPSDDDAVAASSEGDASGALANGHDSDEEEEVVESVGGSDAIEEVLDRAPRYRRQYKIQEVIKRRQVMLVQVVKEERGTKGAALTTYLSLAGRYCVLMPNTARGGGISRKITSIEDRKKLRMIAEELEVPDGMGVILRTAGAARTRAEVKRDFEYLLRLWETVRDLTLKSTAPKLVYEEGSLAKRSIRDLYSKDVEEIVVAGEQGYRDAKEFMRMLMPSHAKNVKLYQDSQPIFMRYGIESQLDAMFSPTVQLRSGGYIVINQTEALVSIDVNSGRSTREHHIEDTALKTNVEAAEEIARQLRLRDLAGLIVIDFIDMDEKRNNRTVERRLKDALRNDRARIQVGRISHFGLLEMSRQRIRTSVLESSTEKCALCGGTGHVRSVSSVALQLLRSLEEMLLKGPTHNLIVRTRPEIALYVLNQKRAHLRDLEERFRISVTVSADEHVAGTTGYAIERGEQAMSHDQAMAVVAQAQKPPLLIEEAEPEVEDAIDETEADEAADRAEPAHPGEAEAGGESGFAAHPEPVHEEAGRDNGRGHRRRRRRGRGRGGEGRGGREGGEFPPRHDQPSFDHGNAAHEASQDVPFEAAQPGAAYEPTAEDMTAEAQHAGQPHHDEGRRHDGDNGSGGRRRRRGRRGGRRNRRDREGAPHGEAAGAPHQPMQDRGEWNEQPPADIAEATYAPHIEPGPEPHLERPVEPPPVAAPPPQPAPPATTAPEPPPRRRSTVREPAPVFSQDAPAVISAPLPQRSEPIPPPIVSSPGEGDDSRPRRTGWWAKRLLGGDKG